MNLFDILFPKTCIRCLAYGDYICDLCKNNLKKLDLQFCIVCGKYSNNGLTHKICKTKYSPILTFSAFEYTGIAKDIILQSKGRNYSYQQLQTLADRALKSNLFPNINSEDLIFCPIPMTSKFPELRFKNHSEIISNYFAQNFKSKSINIFVKKIGTPQKLLSKTEREEKKIQFKVYEDNRLDLKNNSIILIDDVSTTGSTLFQASRKLIELGAKNVYCYTLCKDLMYN